MPNEPAYHSGLSRLGRLPNSLQPGLAPGEVIGLLARRVEHEFADFRVTGEQGLGVIQRLGGHLTGMVYAHQGGGFPLLVGGEQRRPLPGHPGWRGGAAAGRGRPAAGGASRARRARSAAEIKVSREGPVAMGGNYRPGLRGS